MEITSVEKRNTEELKLREKNTMQRKNKEQLLFFAYLPVCVYLLVFVLFYFKIKSLFSEMTRLKTEALHFFFIFHISVLLISLFINDK